MTVESIAHQFRKLQADGSFRTTSSTPTYRTTTSSSSSSSSPRSSSNNNLNLPPPPAYTPSTTLPIPMGSFPNYHQFPYYYDCAPLEDDDEYGVDENDGQEHYQDTYVDINVPIEVVGNLNVVSLNSLTTSLSMSINNTFAQHQQLRYVEPAAAGGQTHHHRNGPHRPTTRPLGLRVNCPVSIQGDRNIVGDVVPDRPVAVYAGSVVPLRVPGEQHASVYAKPAGTTTTCTAGVSARTAMNPSAGSISASTAAAAATETVAGVAAPPTSSAPATATVRATAPARSNSTTSATSSVTVHAATSTTASAPPPPPPPASSSSSNTSNRPRGLGIVTPQDDFVDDMVILRTTKKRPAETDPSNQHNLNDPSGRCVKPKTMDMGS